MSANYTVPPLQDEEIKRPGIISQLIPYIITFIIFYLIFRGRDLGEVWRVLKQADLSLFLPAMALFVTAFFLADVFSFGSAYRWFNTPMTIREMMECRAGPYVVQIGLAPLAEAMFPLYLWRKKGVRVTETLSTNLWTVIVDMSSVFAVLTAAVIYNLLTGLVPEINWIWLMVCVIFWAAFLGNVIFWHSRYKEKAAAWIEERSGAERESGILGWRGFLQKAVRELLTLLRTFSKARWHHYLKIFGIRIVMLGTNLLSHFAALYALGVEPPLPLMLIGVPIIMLGVFLPISVGGYGGPQALALLFFVKVVPCSTVEVIMAYSLLWSTCFLAGRAFFGLIFVRGFFKGAFPQGFKFRKNL